MSNNTKGLIALLFLTLFWAIAGVIPRFLESSFTLFQQVYLRLFLATIFSYILFRNDIHLKKFSLLSKSEWGLLLLRSISYYTLGVVLFTQATLLTKISNVAFITSLPFTAMLGFILLKERVSAWKIFWIVCSFMGVILIAVQGTVSLRTFGLGELCAFGSSFLIGFALVTRKWHSDRLNDKELATSLLLLGAFFVFIGSIFLKHEGIPHLLMTSGAFWLVVLGGVVNVGISYCMNYGLSRVSAMVSNNIFALTPLFTATLGFLLFREIPLGRELVGGIIIIMSAYAIHQSKS